MSDGWTCSLCNQRLSTNSNSAHSVAFDLEIRSHVTAHECTCEGETVCDRCSLRKNLW
jgi:hypothetical protein